MCCDYKISKKKFQNYFSSEFSLCQVLAFLAKFLYVSKFENFSHKIKRVQTDQDALKTDLVIENFSKK